MIEIFRDSIWQFVGAIIAVIALGISVIFFILQRNKKSLSYDVLSNISLLYAREEIQDELQILYKGISVKNVSLLILKIINDGNQPIKTTDFEKPLSFTFSQNTQVLSAEVFKVSPENLEVVIENQNDRITLNPLLFNNGDFISLKIILNNFERKIKADTRIIGVKDVKHVKNFSWQIYILPVTFLILAVLFIPLLLFASKPSEYILFSLIPLLFLASFALHFSEVRFLTKYKPYE